MDDATTIVGQIKSKVDEIGKLALPKSEADERFKKVEEDVRKILEAQKKEVERKAMAPSGDVDGAGAWFVKHGYDSIAKVKALDVFERDSKMQTVETEALPGHVRQALKLLDEIFIADKILTHKSESWRDKKQGANLLELYTKSFGEAGRRLGLLVKDMLSYQGKTLTSTGAGTGDEWVPTLMATNLLDEIRVQAPVVNLIPHLPQPSNPWQLPILSTVNTAFRRSTEGSSTGLFSNLTTRQILMTAHTCVVGQKFSDEMDEDSAIAIAPTVRQAIITGKAQGLEMALVNGDASAAAHIDNDLVQASAPFEYHQGGFSGLRQYALDPGSAGTASVFDASSAAALTDTHVFGAIGKMGRFAATKLASGDVVLLVGAKGWTDLLKSTKLVTVDQFGSRATLLNGEIGRLAGIPVMLSFGVDNREVAGLDSTGVNNASGALNIESTAVLFNRMAWVIGDRRDVRFETDRPDIAAGSTDLVASARWSFMPVEGDSTDTTNFDPSAIPSVVAIINFDK